MKFILLILFFFGILFSHENFGVDAEIQMISESTDFDIIDNLIDNDTEKSEVKQENLENSEQIPHFDGLKPEGSNVLKFPQLSLRYATFCNNNLVGRLQIE